MVRNALVLLSLLLTLAACDGLPGSHRAPIYWVRDSDAATVQYRMLDSVNSLRTAAGAAPLALNAELTAAAATQARDMSVQNRPWHFGSDGSSPLQRVARTGYGGRFVGETLSETYETELETLAAWMDRPDTRAVILDKRAKNVGFSWYQERSGKLWWVLTLGS